MLAAGFETTVNLIRNDIVALLTHHVQWKRLSQDPVLVTQAVEELLCHGSPVQITSRTATEDVTLDGTTIAKGASIIVAVGGANRDSSAPDETNHLRIDRADASKHLSFSFGIHPRLGAAPVRLESRAILEELTRRHSTLQLATTPIRRPLLVLRGFEHIPVRVE